MSYYATYTYRHRWEQDDQYSNWCILEQQIRSIQAQRNLSPDDDLKENRRDFFETFRPFLFTRGHKGEIEIHLRTDGDVIEKDQSRVADLFADYFSTFADGIGGDKSKLD